MVVAQPWDSLTGNTRLSPVSEVFTNTVSAQFVGGANGPFNITQTTILPNGSTHTSTFIRVIDIGTLVITISGKGGLSVGNILWESVEWIVPAGFVKNLTGALVTFHTFFAMPIPSVILLGVPQFADIPLKRTSDLNVTDIEGKQVILDQIWKGSAPVTFVESGNLPSVLSITNAKVTNSTGATVPITFNGELPAVIQIGPDVTTTTVRNNDWVTTLTFAILLFAVLDLGAYESAQQVQPNQAEVSNSNRPPKQSAKEGGQKAEIGPDSRKEREADKNSNKS
jgi:hypothetical protein